MTLSPLKTGLQCRCPSCGEGKLYVGYIKVGENCPSCGVSFEKADSGDGPAFFVMMAVGLVVVFSAMFVELNYRPDYWVHVILWLPLTLFLTLVLLPFIKSLLISFQFHHEARESRFTPLDNEDDNHQQD